MKKNYVLLMTLIISAFQVSAQDTLYIYKAGAIISKNAINQIDSISFSTPLSSASTIKDADNNIYHAITIGTQTWMLENLKTTKFNDGAAIPEVTGGVPWTQYSSAAFCNYDNNPVNGLKYGRLYNGYAALSNKLAPKGWHVATNIDWVILKNYIENQYGVGKDGKAIAANTDWTEDSTHGTNNVGNDITKNNSSGFTALPGGMIDGTWGRFQELGNQGFWWTSTELAPGYIEYKWLNKYSSFIDYNVNGNTTGYSVRCVKD